tara:strand:+ start:279 stop:539 length:261 start_codon:yes stop_codon:yes gene_type:complete
LKKERLLQTLSEENPEREIKIGYRKLKKNRDAYGYTRYEILKIDKVAISRWLPHVNDLSDKYFDALLVRLRRDIKDYLKRKKNEKK